MSVVYLQRAGRKLVCHCTCRTDALIAASSQQDCPWCGCGWLFTCMTCRKAFTFARGVEVDATLEDLATRDLTARDGEPPSNGAARNWVDWMTILLKAVAPGREYVYIDGFYVPTDTVPLQFDGWHARHDLPWVPQAQALRDPSALAYTLGSEDYWREHETDEHLRSRTSP